jgi:hypothetical protein
MNDVHEVTAWSARSKLFRLAKKQRLDKGHARIAALFGLSTQGKLGRMILLGNFLGPSISLRSAGGSKYKKPGATIRTSLKQCREFSHAVSTDIFNEKF